MLVYAIGVRSRFGLDGGGYATRYAKAALRIVAIIRMLSFE